MSLDLAALRASAERGMTEDAEPAHAAARERLLQHYRDASAKLGLDELEWIASLAKAGHVPAGALLERSLPPAQVERFLASGPQRIVALAALVPSLARYLAWKELRTPAPRLPQLLEWLEAGGYETESLAKTLRELQAIAGAPSAADLSIITRKLYDHAPGEFPFDDFDASDLLLACGRHRSGAAEEKERGFGRALIERAAALGSDEAAEELFTAAFNAAPRKPEFMQEWFGAGKPMAGSAVRPCLQMGAGFERAARLDEAIPWYERAVGRKAGTHPGALDMEFCYAMAHAFDRRAKRRLVVDDAELAMKWHARAAEVGDERCLDTWLKTCAEGQMGLVPDPDAALERAQRFRASGVDIKSRRWRLGSGLRAVHAAAAAEQNAARAAKWREVAALLEKD